MKFWACLGREGAKLGNSTPHGLRYLERKRSTILGRPVRPANMACFTRMGTRKAPSPYRPSQSRHDVDVVYAPGPAPFSHEGVRHTHDRRSNQQKTFTNGKWPGFLRSDKNRTAMDGNSLRRIPSLRCFIAIFSKKTKQNKTAPKGSTGHHVSGDTR